METIQNSTEMKYLGSKSKGLEVNLEEAPKVLEIDKYIELALAHYKPFTKGENAIRDIYLSPDNICEISVFYPDHFGVFRDELGISKDEVHDAFSKMIVDEKLNIKT